MATALTGYNGGQVLVFVMGAFAKMSGDVSRICDIIAHELARAHVSYYNGDAKRTKGTVPPLGRLSLTRGRCLASRARKMVSVHSVRSCGLSSTYAPPSLFPLASC